MAQDVKRELTFQRILAIYTTPCEAQNFCLEVLLSSVAVTYDANTHGTNIAVCLVCVS